jgi:hypothetical protein
MPLEELGAHLMSVGPQKPEGGGGENLFRLPQPPPPRFPPVTTKKEGTKGQGDKVVLLPHECIMSTSSFTDTMNKQFKPDGIKHELVPEPDEIVSEPAPPPPKKWCPSRRYREKIFVFLYSMIAMAHVVFLLVWCGRLQERLLLPHQTDLGALWAIRAYFILAMGGCMACSVIWPGVDIVLFFGYLNGFQGYP